MEFPSQFNVLALSALPVFWMLWELGVNRMFSSVLAVLCARDVLEAPSVLGCFGRATGSVDALGAQVIWLYFLATPLFLLRLEYRGF